MANQKQLEILKQGVEVWNRWRDENHDIRTDLRGANLSYANLIGADLIGASLTNAKLVWAYLSEADLTDATLNGANLNRAHIDGAKLTRAKLTGASFIRADLSDADLSDADFSDADFSDADFNATNFTEAKLMATNLRHARVTRTNFGNLDLGDVIGLEEVEHWGPSQISTDTFIRSKGKIPEGFLRGCGLSDWEIEAVKLYNPDLTNYEINDIQYRMYELRATQALQISPLFVSYNHVDDEFVDKIGNYLTKKGVRYWRDVHNMKAGRIEKQIDRAIRQNSTVLLVLSEHSLKSDWVEHEVRTARELEKEIGRDVLCPVALDDSWKSSRWPKRVMEQITEYNILDFSAWEDDDKFDSMFRKLIDGLELFYKG